MEYTINNLAQLAGLSTRALRYYDQIGLLHPTRINSNDYRIYSEKEIDALQQILFYRELGMALKEIKKIMQSEDFDVTTSLENHLSVLLQKRERLDILINNVKKTISKNKGEIAMSDKEKFEGFKEKLIEENEKKYGKEMRSKYGNEAVNESNEKLQGLSKEEYIEGERLQEELDETLRAALLSNNPSSELAQKACNLHRRWLCIYYPHYNKEYHKALGELYVSDERFKAYYDRIAPGCAEFLRDAINIYCE